MKKIINKLLITTLAFLLLLTSGNFTTTILAEEQNDEYDYDDYSAYVISNQLTIAEMMTQVRYVYSNTGHGIAAERANDLIDHLKLIDAQWVGPENIKDGADRQIKLSDGTVLYIQDKYYQTAKESVRKAFGDDGLYRYLDSNGNPMQLEVPLDQYDEAVEAMRKMIEDGRVPNVKDPKEAENLVRKGNVTYEQAKNLTKAFTKESLLFDAKTGTITALSAFGISTVIDFGVRTINGENYLDALKGASLVGLKSAANAFTISIIGLQLLKTDAPKVFKPAAEKIVQLFGDDFAKAVLKAAGQSVGKNFAEAAIKVVQNELLLNGVTIVVLSAPSAVDCIRGRISAQQMAKDIVIILVGLAGNTAGYIIGNSFGGPVVGIAGGIAVGWLAQKGGEYIAGKVLEEDSEKMLKIIQEEYYQLCVDYFVNDKEAETVANMLSKELSGTKLKDMFASEDRNSFARELMVPLFEEISEQRQSIDMPSDIELRRQSIDSLEGIVFIH